MDGNPGSQRVGIVRQVPELDDDGNEVLTDLREPKTVDSVFWVDGASFELQNQTSPAASEQQTATETTTRETAWSFLPVLPNGWVPGVQIVNGNELSMVMAVRDIDSRAAIRYPFPDGRDYQMRGDAQPMEDIDGIADHVFCLAERQTG